MAGVKKVAVSAPGKVLIAGGYLILDPDQIGLVLALSARIHVVVSSSATSSKDEGIITVTSPQFLNAKWTYQCSKLPESKLKITNLTPESSNDYVRITVSYVLAFLQLNSIQSVDVTILADNDYYSQTSSPTYSHLSSLPRFNQLNMPISEANKTGLGSSAALITALTAAMLAFFSDIDISSDDGKRTVHNLAQAAHCAAQGKVGSGFDIAAAVYGSCIYRRFKPEVLEHVLTDSDVYDGGFMEELNKVVGTTWDMEATPFRLPVGLRIVMGDVAAGSATPSMVRSVLKWKASVSGAEKVWKDLGEGNKRLIEVFSALQRFPSDELVAELREGINNVRSTSRPALYEALDDVMTEFEVIRTLLRQMGIESSVPIEPDTQMELLYSCLRVNGTLIAGVPGAGGYDAIFCIIADDGEGEGSTFRKLLDLWEGSEVRVCPLLAREESRGVLLEDADALLP